MCECEAAEMKLSVAKKGVKFCKYNKAVIEDLRVPFCI